MRLTGERRPYHNWPKVREHGADGYSVQGYCPTAAGFRMHRRLGFIAITGVGLILLASATMGVWGPAAFDATEGTQGFVALKRLASVQWCFRDLLTERYPGVGRSIGYGHRTGIDWHLGVLAVVCLGGRRILTDLLADCLGFITRPLTAKRVRIIITPDHVRLGGRLFGKTLERDDDGPNPIRFRLVSAEAYYLPSDQDDLAGTAQARPARAAPPAVVEVTHGYRRHKLVIARREDQAEAVVDRCNEVMKQTERQIDAPIA